MAYLTRIARNACGWLGRAFEQVAKAEIKLVAIALCTVAISIPGSILLSLNLGQVDTDTEVYDCKPIVGAAMQRWIDEQQYAGVVATLTPFPDKNISAAPLHLHIHYTASGLALLKVKLNVAAAPLPDALIGNCKVGSYSTTMSQAEASAVIGALELMLPAYVAIGLLVPWSLRSRSESLVRGLPWRQGLHSIPSWCLPLGVATWAGMSMLTWWFAIDMHSVRDVSMIEASLWVAIAVAIVAAPIFEELLFRRWLLDGFLRANMPVFGSVVVSINFALPHLTHYELSTAFFATFALFFAISLVLCWVYARTRNVFACMAVHCAHNASALVAGWLVTAPSP